MTKNDKRVSINTMDGIIKDRFENVVTVQWCDIDVKIKKNLSFTEMLEFVNDVVMSCFQEDGGFMPEVMDFAIKSNIMTKYANFSMPDNLEHRYEILYRTDAVDMVCGQINGAQLNEIISSINKKIEYMCNSNAMMIQNRMNALVSAFEDMQGKTEELFKGISADDISKIASAVADGSLNEEKIVEAYLNKITTNNDAVEGE